jgi:hypothetical protein
MPVSSSLLVFQKREQLHFNIKMHTGQFNQVRQYVSVLVFIYLGDPRLSRHITDERNAVAMSSFAKVFFQILWCTCLTTLPVFCSIMQDCNACMLMHRGI